MSSQCVAWAWEVALDPISKLALLAIAECADDEWESSATFAWLVKVTAIPERTLRRRITALEEEEKLLTRMYDRGGSRVTYQLRPGPENRPGQALTGSSSDPVTTREVRTYVQEDQDQDPLAVTRSSSGRVNPISPPVPKPQPGGRHIPHSAEFLEWFKARYAERNHLPYHPHVADKRSITGLLRKYPDTLQEIALRFLDKPREFKWKCPRSILKLTLHAQELAEELAEERAAAAPKAGPAASTPRPSAPAELKWFGIPKAEAEAFWKRHNIVLDDYRRRQYESGATTHAKPSQLPAIYRQLWEQDQQEREARVGHDAGNGSARPVPVLPQRRPGLRQQGGDAGDVQPPRASADLDRDSGNAGSGAGNHVLRRGAAYPAARVVG